MSRYVYTVVFFSAKWAENKYEYKFIKNLDLIAQIECLEVFKKKAVCCQAKAAIQPAYTVTVLCTVLYVLCCIVIVSTLEY